MGARAGGWGAHAGADGVSRPGAAGADRAALPVEDAMGVAGLPDATRTPLAYIQASNPAALGVSPALAGTS